MGIASKMLKLLTSLLFVGLSFAQDTTYCNDGWELYTTEWRGGKHHSCFWFGSKYERVSHDSAKAICNQLGGFLAEVPYGPHLNYWIVKGYWRRLNCIQRMD